MSKPLPNKGIRLDNQMLIQRHFERQAYLEMQRPQKGCTPELIAVVSSEGDITLRDYGDVIARNLKVLRHPLNFYHLFGEDQLVDAEIVAIPPELTLNESFNYDFSG